MRLVLDANVIVSAALTPNSTSFRVLEKALEGNTLLISENSFEELKTVLYKPKFERYFTPEDTRPNILKIVLKFGELIATTVKIKACRDPKDDLYLELAVSGKADCIITRDIDLLILSPFENIPILTPKDFLEKF